MTPPPEKLAFFIAYVVRRFMTRRMSYHGWCNRYGENTMKLGALFVPALLTNAFHKVAESAPALAEGSVTGAIMGGVMGFVAATAAHAHANHYASAHNYGMSRGSRLVKQWQAAAYATTLTLSIAAGTALGMTQQEITPPKTPETAITQSTGTAAAPQSPAR